MEIIEEISAYRRMDSKTFGKDNTYSTPDTVAKVRITKTRFLYVVPYGEGYECDGGHHVETLSQVEFDKRYSLAPGANLK